MAAEWLAKHSPNWSTGYVWRLEHELRRDVFPYVGARPVAELTAPDLLAVVRRVEERGHLRTAHNVLRTCGRVLRYAVATGRAERDVSWDLRGALPPVRTKHFAAITDPREVGPLLRQLDGYSGTLPVRCALRLAPLVFVRLGELVTAEWAGISLEGAEWRYTVTKTGTPHVVPLARGHLRSRSLDVSTKPGQLQMADGNAAIWGAARTVWPEASEQRCWNHKMRNVLDQLPQREQSEAKELLRTVVYASTRAAALKARQAFGKCYGPWYPKTVTVLEDDWDRMVTFYDFPAAHWKHLRTTNVVESPFASVRLRTSAVKRFKRVDSATALIWKLLTVAEKRFRRLDAPHLLKDVFEERKFRDGKPVSDHQRKAAA